MIGGGEHFGVTSRGVPLQFVLPDFTCKAPDLMSTRRQLVSVS
jgi:hypothetical protein